MAGRIGFVAAMMLAALSLMGCSLIATPAPTATPVIVPPPAPGNDPNAPDLRVSIAEKYAQKEMLASLQADKTLQKPVLDFQPGNRIRASATVVTPVPREVPVLGGQTITVRPTIVLTFQVVSNRMVVAIESVDLGGLALPRSVVEPQLEQIRKEIESQANQTIQRAVAGTNLKLVAGSTTEDSLVVDFRE